MLDMTMIASVMAPEYDITIMSYINQSVYDIMPPKTALLRSFVRKNPSTKLARTGNKSVIVSYEKRSDSVMKEIIHVPI